MNLEHPPAIHDVHNVLPLAPQKLKIPIKWRSDYANSFGFNVGSAAEKLAETLLDKHRYICQYENLEVLCTSLIERCETPSDSKMPEIKMAQSLHN